MRRIEEAREWAESVVEQFPEDEFFITETRWADGDFEVKVVHSIGHTEGDNVLRTEGVMTPHSCLWRLVEVTGTETMKVHLSVK